MTRAKEIDTHEIFFETFWARKDFVVVLTMPFSFP